MKTPAIIALSIIGVLATTGAAMAVNGATLAAFNKGTIGQATEVLVPTSTPTPSSTPSSTPAPTRAADDDNGLRGDGSVDDDSDSTGGVPSPSQSNTSDDDHGYDDSYDDDSGHDDSAEHEDESEDDD